MSEPSVAILSDIACRLGEGPSYEPETDTLWWFDIADRKLLEHRFGPATTTVHDLPVRASAIATVDSDRQLIVAENGLHLRDRATGKLSLHRATEPGDPPTRSNDARVHPSGALWFGTMGLNAERKAGAIWWHRGGEIRLLIPSVTVPNSICFSASGDAAFFADTMKNILFRVACDPATGLPSGEPAMFLDQRGMAGGIDGSVIDADGVLWNARWGSGRLDAYGPDGAPLRSIPVPARQTSCPAFVGAWADRIAVTSAWEHMDGAARQADPHAGKTFVVDLDVRGRFEPHAVI